ncbi:MAG: HlyC/CorC family transporter [Lachnospiraceae bacterium]|nr:HlyC/CorC family transporter [Lachnospiraceae bacterium]
MDSGDAVRIVILVFLLVLSAFFSSAETALTAVNKLKVRSLASEGNKRAILVGRLIEDSSKVLSTILIGNNIVNLSASALTTAIALSHGSGLVVSIATGALTLLIIIFGEIAPKTLASLHPEKLSFSYAPLIRAICVILTPIVFIINLLARGILRLFGVKKADKDHVTEGELRTMVEVSHEDGVIESEEREMITNVVDFGDALAKDVMVPRIDVSFAEEGMSYNDLLEAFKRDKYSRMPVYSESKDNVTGIINLKDVFLNCTDKRRFNIKNYMREPFFTYEFKKTSELLAQMREAHISIAIVLDEYGVTSGLITLEDLLEEIVGEIRDEYDNDEQDVIRKISDEEYETDGTAKLDDINDYFGLKLESDDYDSIAGHIIHKLGHLPEVGESISIPLGDESEEEHEAPADDEAPADEDSPSKQIVFTVDKVDKNRIDLVRIRIA